MATIYLYNQLMNSLSSKEIDFSSDDLKVMLTTLTYIPIQGEHRYKSSVTGEISGDGYTTGGESLTNVRYSVSSGTGNLSADNVVWSSLTADNIHYGVIYDNSPSEDSNKPLIAYIDFEENKSVVNTDVEIIWGASGILKMNLG